MNTQRIQVGPVAAELEIITVGNISLTLDYNHFVEGSNDEIADFLNSQINRTLSYLLTRYSTVKVNMSGLCDMLREDGLVDNMARVNVKGSKVYRHAASRQNIVHSMLLRLFNPKQYQEEYGDVQIEGDNSGSKFSMVEKIIGATITFTTPLEYIANALPPKYQIVAGLPMNKYISHVPKNNDPYCFMHCLYNELKPKAEFKKWFEKHNLGRFYQANFFYIDLVPEIEDELGCSINIYNRIGDDELELYYRSSYKKTLHIINIVVMGLNYFEHRYTKVLASEEDVSIESTKDVEDHNFLGRSNFKEFINTRKAHAVVLRPSWFSSKINSNHTNQVCRYCTYVCKPQALPNHEINCLAHHRQSSGSERVKNYVDAKTLTKEFKSWRALFQIPFVTYDWETRLNDAKQHVPFSYALVYVNIFNHKKSIIYMNSNFQDPKKLVEEFIEDCKKLTIHHHDVVQSVDTAFEKPELTKEIRDAGCPWCKSAYNEKNPPEYNHSHFIDDTLNEKLNTYVCMDCNRKAMVRNLPLKFYAHNGSRYDHNLFMPQLLNDSTMMNHEFVNKNESRFSEVKMGFKVKEDDIEFDHFSRPIAKYKMSFNDSCLLLGASLSKLAEAWITKKDHDTLKTFISLFYTDVKPEGIEVITAQSGGKQVFPYDALSHEELLESTVEIPRKFFNDTFKGTEVSARDYLQYLRANATLRKHVPGHNFLGFHDFYLLLDVVLLAVILMNFQKSCHEMSDLNPLMFLSTSSYSFNALLYHNKQNPGIKKITLPRVDVGRFIKASIHGGFTFIFNRKNLRGPKDYTHYFDFTSLYPTIMALCELPYKFKEWLDLEELGTEGAITFMKANPKYYYFVETDIKALDQKFQKKAALYPMFPETQTIYSHEYSADQRHRYSLNTDSALKDQEINTVSFYEKKGYVTSWSYLKQAMEVGYEVEKITKVAVFHKSFVLKDYIEKMYQLKLDLTRERDELKKNGDPEGKLSGVCAKLSIAKLILNAIYGFCLVNVDNHNEAQLHDLTEENSAKIQKQASSLRFKSLIKVGDRVVINRMKNTYSYDYPLHIGSAILFESKLLMARYIFNLYDWLGGISPELEIHPCFTDTDSYCMSVKNFKDHFESIDEFSYRFNKEVYPLFDTSANEPEFQMPETHTQLGFMTNETDNKEITSWVGIACKAYSYNCCGKEKTTGKGISEALQAQCLNFKLYESIVDGSILEGYAKEKYSVSYNDFKAQKFNVETVGVKKCFTTLVDLKTYCPENSTKCYIFGSKEHLDFL